MNCIRTKTISIFLKSFAIVMVSTAVFLFSCLRLDSFLFSGENLNSYQFDSYTGKRECSDIIDSLGLIDTLNIYEKFIKSGNETIAAIILSEKQQIDQHDTIILYYHGNAAHIDLYWPRFRLLHSCGYPVMIIDYRGYGLSTGKATEDGIYEDGFAALNYIRDSLGNPNVIIYAYSLGSLVGCEIATKHINDKILGLILEAPIGSVETLVQDATYMNMPGAYFTSFKGNNAERIKTFKKPLLWFHGTKDETLAYETNGKLVWNSYSGPEGYHYRVEGGGHANLPKLTGYNRYRTMVQKFITGKGSSDPFLVKK